MIFRDTDQLLYLAQRRVLAGLDPAAERADRLHVAAGRDQQVLVFAARAFRCEMQVQQPVIGENMPGRERIGGIKLETGGPQPV